MRTNAWYPSFILSYYIIVVGGDTMALVELALGIGRMETSNTQRLSYHNHFTTTNKSNIEFTITAWTSWFIILVLVLVLRHVEIQCWVRVLRRHHRYRHPIEQQWSREPERWGCVRVRCAFSTNCHTSFLFDHNIATTAKVSPPQQYSTCTLRCWRRVSHTWFVGCPQQIDKNHHRHHQDQDNHQHHPNQNHQQSWCWWIGDYVSSTVVFIKTAQELARQ